MLYGRNFCIPQFSVSSLYEETLPVIFPRVIDLFKFNVIILIKYVALNILTAMDLLKGDKSMWSTVKLLFLTTIKIFLFFYPASCSKNILSKHVRHICRQSDRKAID